MIQYVVVITEIQMVMQYKLMAVCIKDAVMFLSLAEIVEYFTHLRTSIYECIFDWLIFTFKRSKADIEKTHREATCNSGIQ